MTTLVTPQYPARVDHRARLGERIPKFITLGFVEDDGETPKDVTGHIISAEMKNGSTTIPLALDRTDEAVGEIVVALDTRAPNVDVGSWWWDVAHVDGSDAGVDPVDITVGGVIEIEPAVTVVP